MGYQDHKSQAEKSATRSVACAVITCSDSRTHEDDDSGIMIRTTPRIPRPHPPLPHHLQRRPRPDQNPHRRAHRPHRPPGNHPQRRHRRLPSRQHLRCRHLLPHQSPPRLRRNFPHALLSEPSVRKGWPSSPAPTAGNHRHPDAGPTGLPHRRLLHPRLAQRRHGKLAMTKLILPEISHLVWETIR